MAYNHAGTARLQLRPARLLLQLLPAPTAPHATPRTLKQRSRARCRASIGILGAGIIGSAAAVQLAERLGSRHTVTIVADKFADASSALIADASPTSSGAAGFWKPYSLEVTAGNPA